MILYDSNFLFALIDLELTHQTRSILLSRHDQTKDEPITYNNRLN